MSPSTPGRTFSSGIRQSSKASCEVTAARSDIFILCSDVVNPGVPFSTRKPWILPSYPPTFAQTTATSAIEPFVIHALAPFRTQWSPSFFATVRIPPGFEPKSGSVRPKQPIASPLASAGIQRSFCSFDPYFQIGNMTRDDWTETNDRRPESPRSSSCVMSP